MASAHNNQTMAPAATWLAHLGDSATEVFSMMVGVSATASENRQLPVLDHVTGAVGIAGAITTIVSLRCSAESATKIASQMLGVSTEEAISQKCDAVGEICNMVAGQFKAKIGLEDKCMLSVPTVITGGSYRIHSPVGSDHLELPFIYEGEPVWIALEIRK